MQEDRKPSHRENQIEFRPHVARLVVISNRSGRPSAASVPSPDRNPGDDARAGTVGTGEDVCPRCAGKGKLNGSQECPDCDGTGIIVQGIGGG